MKNLLMLSTILASAAFAPFMNHPRTRTVKGQDGEPMVINEEDFDEEKHEDYVPPAGDGEEGGEGDGEQHPSGLSKAEIERKRRIEEMNEPGVEQEGQKFYVVTKNPDGSMERVKGLRGINGRGYDSQKAAWDAIFLVRSEVTALDAS